MKKKKLPQSLFEEIVGNDFGNKRIFSKTASRLLADEDKLGSENSRFGFFKFLTFLILLVLVLRLFQLTIVQGSKNRTLAEENRVRLVEFEAARGRLVDRNGQVVADSVEKFFLEKDGQKTEISGEQALELAEKGLAGENFEGELGRIGRETVRVYPYGQVLAHVTGYTSRVNTFDLEKNQALSSLDFVGRGGVEEVYDQVLRGVNGKRIIEVDSLGKKISILGETPPTAGADIQLTVDGELQKKAYDVLLEHMRKVKAKAAALVIGDVQNGEVLAMVSLPSFEPADIGKYVAADAQPFFNRVIAGSYPPGSVFKLVSALAGLESGKISAQTEIEDVGEFYLGDVKFSNWYYNVYGGRDGFLKIDRAIARSNDIFFYRLAERTGLSEITSWAQKLGFGQKTGIDLPGESFGLVPDEVWKKSQLSEAWFLGDTLHLSIGQGFALATPIQVNMMTAYLANGGKIVKPHLVSKVKKGDGQEIVTNQSSSKEIGVKGDNLNLIAEGMKQACRTGGTAWPFFTAAYEIGCKTGTAERSVGNPHAWFTAFAPYGEPKVAITVLIENGGEGSSVAAPVAREILDWLYKKDRFPQSKDGGNLIFAQNSPRQTLLVEFDSTFHPGPEDNGFSLKIKI